MKKISKELKKTLKKALADRNKDVECLIAYWDVEDAVKSIFTVMGVDEDSIDSLTESCMESEIFMTGSLEEALEFIRKYGITILYLSMIKETLEEAAKRILFDEVVSEIEA
jgi:hypothetical protein